MAQSNMSQASATADTAPASPAVSGYLRPYLGWGSDILTAPEDAVSSYRFGLGLASGVNLSKLTLGVDFNYFLGTAIDGTVENDPSVNGSGRVNAFRLAADIGYSFDLTAVTLRPHVLAGVEWRRISIGDFSQVERDPVWSPAMLALVPLRKDGRFAAGVDARFNLVLIDGTFYSQLSGFLAVESRF
ncbi:MAG TPA: hypothetical protein VGM44_18510 [Polyangiaceae bacterium]